MINDVLRESFISDLNYFRVLYGILLLLGEIVIINYVYINYSHSRENKHKFSRNFLLFGISMYLIVLVIKSSLALSLGMVGALSIIRFRTAVKEPEQIGQFLIIMALSISIAAEKEFLSLIMSFIFSIVSIVQNRSVESVEEESSFVRVNIKDPNEITLRDLINIDEGVRLQSLSKGIDNRIQIEYSIHNIESFHLIESYFNDSLNTTYSISMIRDEA
jgi:hypothetical protein